MYSLSATRLELVSRRQYGLQLEAGLGPPASARVRPRDGSRELPVRTPPVNHRASFYSHLVFSIFNGAKYSRYTFELSESYQFSLNFFSFA